MIAAFYIDDSVVYIQARAEGPNALGDATFEVGPGEDFYGLAYEAFIAKRGGLIEVTENGDASFTE